MFFFNIVTVSATASASATFIASGIASALVVAVVFLVVQGGLKQTNVKSNPPCDCQCCCLCGSGVALGAFLHDVVVDVVVCVFLVFSITSYSPSGCVWPPLYECSMCMHSTHSCMHTYTFIYLCTFMRGSIAGVCQQCCQCLKTTRG